MECVDNHVKNSTWNLKDNANELHEILNGIMQIIMSIITQL